MVNFNLPVKVRFRGYTKTIRHVDQLNDDEKIELLRNYASISSFFDVQIVDAEPSRKVDAIIDMVIEHRQITREELMAPTRRRHIVYARQLCMFLLKLKTHNTFKEIGRYFGGKDHTTVIHSIETIKDLMDTDEKVRTEVHYLIAMCG